MEGPFRAASVEPVELAPPYRFVDLYPWDFDDPRTAPIEDPPWEAIIASPTVRGVILKATDGVGYSDRFVEWFRRNFAALVRQIGGARGKTLLLGSYHYVQVFADPNGQADRYCDVLDSVGYGPLEIVPIIDVEAGAERASNARATAEQVVKCVSAVAARIRARTGRRVMLYGRGIMRDLGIVTRMGCEQVWNPSYTQYMQMNGLSRVGGRPGPWELGDVVLWQDVGDGVGDNRTTGLELVLPGGWKIDLSVFVDGPSPARWARCLERLL